MYTLHSLKVAHSACQKSQDASKGIIALSWCNCTAATTQSRASGRKHKSQPHSSEAGVATRPQSRGGQHPVFEPLFRVDALPIPESVSLQDLPSPLRMFTYAREQQTQPSVADPEAWAVQDIQSSDSSTRRSTASTVIISLLGSSHYGGSCTCSIQLPGAPAVCGLGIQAAVHRIDYLGQEHLCKHNACQHAFSLMP